MTNIFSNSDIAIETMSDEALLDKLKPIIETVADPRIISSSCEADLQRGLKEIKERLTRDGLDVHPNLVPIARIMAEHGHREQKTYAQHIVDHMYRINNEWAALLNPKAADKKLQRVASQRLKRGLQQRSH